MVWYDYKPPSLCALLPRLPSARLAWTHRTPSRTVSPSASARAASPCRARCPAGTRLRTATTATMGGLSTTPEACYSSECCWWLFCCCRCCCSYLCCSTHKTKNEIQPVTPNILETGVSSKAVPTLGHSAFCALSQAPCSPLKPSMTHPARRNPAKL